MTHSDEHKNWYKKVLFTVQLVVLVSILITAITNIVLKTGNLPLWTALLGSCLGYLLPTPRFRVSKHTDVVENHSNPPSIPSSVGAI